MASGMRASGTTIPESKSPFIFPNQSFFVERSSKTESFWFLEVSLCYFNLFGVCGSSVLYQECEAKGFLEFSCSKITELFLSKKGDYV